MFSIVLFVITMFSFAELTPKATNTSSIVTIDKIVFFSFFFC